MLSVFDKVLLAFNFVVSFCFFIVVVDSCSYVTGLAWVVPK